MASVESPVDNFINALRFSVSNVASLAIWGIAYFVGIFIAVFLCVFAVIFFNENLPVMIAMLIVTFLIAIALGILLLGFYSRCLKTVIDGGNVMPTGLESPGELVKDGIMTLVIVFEAFAVELICLSPGYAMVLLARPHDSTMMLAGLALILLAFPVILVVLFLNIIQWAVYADTGSLLQGLNPLRPIRLILSNPVGAVIAAVSIFAAYIFFAVVMMVCELLIVTILLMPFLAIAMYGCVMYLAAMFYRQGRADHGLGDIRDAMTTDFSAS